MRTTTKFNLLIGLILVNALILGVSFLAEPSSPGSEDYLPSETVPPGYLVVGNDENGWRVVFPDGKHGSRVSPTREGAARHAQALWSLRPWFPREKEDK